MNKEWYRTRLHEIAAKNGGEPPGAKLFYSVTNTKESDWRHKPWNDWNNWGDIREEFGYSRGEFNTAYDRSTLLHQLAIFIQSLDPPRFPVQDDLRRAKRKGIEIPGGDAIRRQIGERQEVIRALIEFCEGKEEFSGVLSVCLSVAPTDREISSEENSTTEQIGSGWVYLIRAQGAYKIGCSRAPYRRAAEIANQSANGAELAHKLETDDPEGIEQYWHRRFAEKRINGLNKQSGEWFALNADDVKAFKRRKNFM